VGAAVVVGVGLYAETTAIVAGPVPRAHGGRRGQGRRGGARGADPVVRAARSRGRAGDGDGKTSWRRVEEEVGWQAAAGARGRERGRRGGMWRRRPGRGSGCPGGAESSGRAAPLRRLRGRRRRGEDVAKAAGMSSPPRASVSSACCYRNGRRRRL